jgi:hypothetical protein
MLLTLPQETVNEVIAHLRPEKRTLLSLSVVAKCLTEECRRHLFASIHIGSKAKLAGWCDEVPPELSRYVRLLDLDSYPDGSSCVPLILRDLAVHLRSFTQVEQLNIRPLKLYKFGDEDLVDHFSHFSSTVRSVSIRPMGNYAAILKFLALFPHLETTQITSPSITWEQGALDLPNLVCRGDLILKVCRIDTGANILSCLARPTTCYRRMRLVLVKVDDAGPLERFFETCGGSLESIELICCFFSVCWGLTGETSC